MKHVLTLTLAVGLLTGCSPESKTLGTQPVVADQKVDIPKYETPKPQEFHWVTEDGGNTQLEFNPKIDILFVTDNSDSMKATQENLKRNIDKFADGIVQNKMIDFHIGIVSTWDSSVRAALAKKDSYQIGDLRFIKDSKGKSYNQRFLTRKNSQGMLASTIDIGVTPYAEGGPEVEEFFSPILAALEKNNQGSVNEGFFREDAQLVVIIVTDADDSTSHLSPEQMAQALVDFKRGDANKVSVFGVLVREQDPDSVKDWDLRIHPKYHPECFDIVGKEKRNNGKCTGFGPERIEQLIIAANANAGNPQLIRQKFIMGITSPKFGSDLARIGSDIAVKTLEKTIFLQQRPRYDEKAQKIMLRVRYGTAAELQAGRGQVIPQGEDGWLYNPDDNSIHLSGKIKYQYAEGSQFAVDLIPLTLKQ